MIKFVFLAAATLVFSACNDSRGGVMREIQRAEQEEASAVEPPVSLPSGLEIQFQRRGPDQALARPPAEAVVLVHYEGSLVADGSVFDSSFQRGEPVDFPLPAVVRGFSEAIQQMRPGDELIATFPAELGYGAEGRPPVIPPNSALRFRIRLLAYQGADGQVVGTP
jgi:FKBP-type peptidyl-prolyl cis-trans isomerase